MVPPTLTNSYLAFGQDIQCPEAPVSSLKNGGDDRDLPGLLRDLNGMGTHFVNLESSDKMSFLCWYLIYTMKGHVCLGNLTVTLKLSLFYLSRPGTVPPNPSLGGNVSSLVTPVQQSRNQIPGERRQPDHCCPHAKELLSPLRPSRRFVNLRGAPCTPH